MENSKSSQKKSTKNFLNKFKFNNGNKKSSSSVAPQENEWYPTFCVSDSTTTTHHGGYSNTHTMTSRRSNEELQQSVTRSNSVQRRFSFSNVHESGRQRLLAAKRAEYQEKMQAFDDLIQKRRGSTLRALAPDVTSY